MCLAKMCQKRVKKIKRGSTLTRQREARRQIRLRRDYSLPIATPQDENKVNIDSTKPDTSSPQAALPHVFLNLNNPAHVAAQKQALLGLAWRTVALLQRNRLIQQKIIELQRETNEYVASVLQNPAELNLHLQRMGQCEVPVARVTAASEGDAAAAVKEEVEN